MFLRITAAVMLTAAGGFLGAARSEKLRCSLDMCRELGAVIDRTVFLIRYRETDVYTLCRELKAAGHGEKLSFINELPENFVCGEDFHMAWEKAVEGQENLCSEERRIASELGKLLGTSDVSGQLDSAAVLRKETELLENDRRSEYFRKGKMFRSIGLLFGIMAGIAAL